MATDAQLPFVTQKITSLHQFADALGKPATRKKTLVHCHGVFDLLHIGHIRHLQQARQLGDALVVTITPDRFVNKGPHRPAFGEDLRAEALAALACVDHVCINEWPTAVETIQMFCPDVFLKGVVRGAGPRDRNDAIDCEREAVEAVGGRLVLTDTELHSASALINRHTDVLPPRLKAYLAQFRTQPSARDLVAKLERCRELRALVVGPSHLSFGLKHASDRSRERYAGGALAVANVLAGFCDRVALLTAGTGEDVSAGFLDKNVADAVSLEALCWDESLHAKVEQALDCLLDHYDVVLSIDPASGFLSPRATSRIRQRATFLALDLRSWNSQPNSASPSCAADLVVQDQLDARASDGARSAERESSGRQQPAGVAESMARASDCKRVLLTCGDSGVVVYDAAQGVAAEVPAIPVNEVNRVDLLGTREALFALAAACSAAGLSASASGFVANIAEAAASTLAGSGHPLEPTSIYRHIDSLLK